MKHIFIIFLFFALACQNEVNNEEDNISGEDYHAEMIFENRKDSVPEGEENIPDFDSFCTEGGIPALKKFLSQYISPDEMNLLIDALDNYEKLDTDTAMKAFYDHSLFEVAETVSKAFYKFGERYSEEEEYEYTEDWNARIGSCLPFIIFIIDNHFDGPEAYVYTKALWEKSLQTKGEGDDTFFSADMSCTGDYEAAYSSLHFEQIACDISTSSFGGGHHYKAMLNVIRADSVSTLFKSNLNRLAEYILSEEEIITFGYSKEDVYTEIDQILSLKTRTRYDFSNVENLKRFIDTTSRELYFNCLDGSCPP